MLTDSSFQKYSQIGYTLYSVFTVEGVFVGVLRNTINNDTERRYIFLGFAGEWGGDNF